MQDTPTFDRQNLILSPHDIHIWCVDLNNPPVEIQALKVTLSPDELERAVRFKFERDQQYFIAARGMLRLILARYLNAEPETIQFSYGSHNKPQLAAPLNTMQIEFNVAHSEGYALYAIAHGIPVGVDIESMTRAVNCTELAERFFSPAEYQNLMQLPESLRQEAFFCAWTRKEAVIKALGLGLSFPLDQFTVSLDPRQPAVLLDIAGGVAKEWSLISYSPVPGFLGALAVHGIGYRISFRAY